jgi:hypothetical protein
MAGQGVTLYATTSSGNKTVIGSIDWREATYMPAQINDNVAQIMADIRTLANNIAAGWIEIGDSDGVYTATYIAANQFRIDGADVTGYYRVGMRVRVIAPTPVQLFGTITASVFATHTTITVAWDSGALSNEAITAVYIGVGSGDTANLNAVRHDCRLVYGNSTTMRLLRSGGSLLTIDNAPQVILAAGVNFVPIAGSVGVNPLYVYAAMGGGVMSMFTDNQVAVADPRNGMLVHPTNAAATLVGMAYVSAGPALVENAANQAVSSYYNRRPRAYSLNQSNSTTSATIVPLHNPVYVLCWQDSAIVVAHTGWAQLNPAGTAAWQILMAGSGAGPQQMAYFPAGNAQTGVGMTLMTQPADGLVGFQLGGYVFGGTGTWNGSTYVTLMG